MRSTKAMIARMASGLNRRDSTHQMAAIPACSPSEHARPIDRCQPAPPEAQAARHRLTGRDREQFRRGWRGGSSHFPPFFGLPHPRRFCSRATSAAVNCQSLPTLRPMPVDLARCCTWRGVMPRRTATSGTSIAWAPERDCPPAMCRGRGEGRGLLVVGLPNRSLFKLRLNSVIVRSCILAVIAKPI